jgi:hypothetical protein
MYGGCSLVDHGRNIHQLNEDSRKSMTGGQECEEVSFVHTNLPKFLPAEAACPRDLVVPLEEYLSGTNSHQRTGLQGADRKSRWRKPARRHFAMIRFPR